MNNEEWVLLDTETNGITEPIFPVELAAQTMKGWHRSGPPFRYLLNHDIELSAETSRVNGYTREILTRDGEEPRIVYDAFRTYAQDLPLVAYNLSFDLDKVLVPEWTRLGILPIGRRGFCALRLTQRLLDPVPAGNCKLQTIRQYYKLPERGAHTALGDVETLIDLFRNVLSPIAETRKLLSWADLQRVADEEWFPSRLLFGKYKGRDFHDARRDPRLREWLEWLAASSNARSVRMGQWYLDELRKTEQTALDQTIASPFPLPEETSETTAETSAGVAALVLYLDRDLERLRALISFARARLAEVQSEYMTEKSAVDATNAALFAIVCEHYERRDRLRLIVEYRKKYLEALLARGEEEADEVAGEFHAADEETKAEYEEAARATSGKTNLSDEQGIEIKALWKKLVSLFHPDRHAGTPQEAVYELLTAAINYARDEGDLALLREIADDPNAYIAKQGWGALNVSREDTAEDLRKLYEAIELEIVERLEALTRLRESADYELMKASRAAPGTLDRVAEHQIKAIEIEIEQLTSEASRLAAEIEELTGEQTEIRT